MGQSDDVHARRPQPDHLGKTVLPGSGVPILSRRTLIQDAATEPPDLPLPGELVQGRYVVEKHLGHGRFGWVYQVRHEMLEQDFAMKILSPRVACDPSWIARFREEARLTSLLGHDHIVFVTDFGKCSQFGYFFVMEYLDGATLDLFLREHGGTLPLRTAIDLTLECASALEAMHEVGIVHRDIKPSNIMLARRADGSSHCKILDFGIASGVIDAGRTRKVYGSPAYMSPEQTQSMNVDPRADQFSLASVLYELLTGQRPWLIRDWRAATPRGRAKHPPRRPSEVAPQSIPRALDAVVLRALSVDPEERWPKLGDFTYALRAAVELVAIPRSDPRDVLFSLPPPSIPMELASLAEASMVILVESEDLLTTNPKTMSETPSVSLSFRTASRLHREFKRNLSHGGLFIPGPQRPVIGSFLELRLVYEPRACALHLRGEVLAHREGGPDGPEGFGVRLDDTSLARVHKLVRWLGLEIGWTPGDVIERVRELKVTDDLETGAAFLLTRLDRPMPLRELRAMFSGLPFNLEGALTSLAKERLVRVNGAFWIVESEELEFDEATALGEETTVGFHERTLSFGQLRFTPQQMGLNQEPSMTFYSEAEVEEVLEQVEFFKRHQNYLGAINTLRTALDASPTVGVFYQQLAMLHAMFMQDFERARRALNLAMELEPHNRDYRKTREYLETLAQRYQHTGSRDPELAL